MPKESRDWQPPSLETSAATLCATPKVGADIVALARSGLFPPMPEPCPGDWLAEGQPGVKDRPGQTLAQWRSRSGRRPGPRTKTILLVPLGDMGAELDVNALVACVSAFYLGMDVACAPPISSEDLLKNVKSRASRGFGKQLLTTNIHELLHRLARPDAFVVMGFTMFDLYPREEWNFVFGQAMASKGTGVFSFARYASVSQARFLRRCCMVLTHEIGHLFGFSHCVWYACCMNGSNHDAEADGRPMALCPVCLAKLREAIGPSCNLAQRDALLAAFLEEARLPALAEFHQSCGAVLASLPASETPRGRAPAPEPRGRAPAGGGAGAKGGTGIGAPGAGSAVRAGSLRAAASGTSQARRASSRARSVQRK